MDRSWRAVQSKVVTSSSVDEPAPAPVHHLPPLVTADPPVPVEVWWKPDRSWHPAEVTHWRGDRVNVRVRRGVGLTHLVWVPADEVRRVEGPHA